MSTIHSPKKSTSLDNMISAGGSSISQPDLSKLDTIEPEPKTIYLRKRKVPESDFSFQFDEFKKEIIGVLKESSKCHIANITTISENISSIKEQLNEIKSTTENLMAENNNFKTQIMTLTDTVRTNEERITSLTNEVQQLKSDLPTTSSTVKSALQSLPTSYDELIVELQERAERSRNIVVAGVAEIHSDSMEDRRKVDRHEIESIIKTIYPDCPQAERVLRLGKYDGKKTRPLKVSFASRETVKTVLRNKANIKVEGVRIYSDQTPHQQKFMINLKKELQQRQENGDENLTIKYIKGIPKIIKQTKN